MCVCACASYCCIHQRSCSVPGSSSSSLSFSSSYTIFFFYASCGGRYKGRTIGGDEFIRRVSASAVIYPSVYASDAPVSHSFHSSLPRVVSSLVSLLPLVSLNHPSLGASISLNGEHSSSGAPTAPHVIRFLLRRVDGLTVIYCSGGKV